MVLKKRPSKIITCDLCGARSATSRRTRITFRLIAGSRRGFARLRPAQLLMLPVHEQCQNAEVVLAALQQRFLTKERLGELTRLYVAETNRLRAEHRAKLAEAPRELDGIKRRAMEILNFMRQGYVNEEWKAELRLNERRGELEAVVAAAQTEPARPALQPHMASVWPEPFGGCR